MPSRNPARISWVLLCATAAATMLSFVKAPYPEELRLQHVLTAIALLGLAAAIHCNVLSFMSIGCLLVFLWLHILGARWIYSAVPYDQWSQSLWGVSISETFGWQRNHYDRLVHLASGLLGVPPSAELLRRWGGMHWQGAAIIAIAVVLAGGAIYEVGEWQIAVRLSPEQAEAYNGQQGDVWDPQKDLALAWIGAMISAACLLLWKAPR